jgi:serine/threonine protein kinase
MNLESHLQQKNVRVGYFSKHRGILVLPSGRYSVGAFLGSGSYSTIYSATHETENTSYSIKVIPIKNNTFASVIREAIIHILLEKESANEPNGPYVPRFYEIAYDSYNDCMILRTETIQDILYDRYLASSAEENDTIIPNTLLQLARILTFFYKRLEFNHRDCKPNNILYNYDAHTGRIQIKVIDFGFSCLCWNGVNIHAGDRMDGVCFRQSRDLTQYIYATYTDSGLRISEPLKREFRDLLTFPVAGQLCRLYKSCRAYGETISMWGQTYRFLNDLRIENPQGTPQVIERRMLEFLGSRQTPAGLPHCVPERVLNPQTRRCVLRASAEGRRVLRLSKRYSTPSPKTLRRYRNSRKKLRALRQ